MNDIREKRHLGLVGLLTGLLLVAGCAGETEGAAEPASAEGVAVEHSEADHDHDHGTKDPSDPRYARQDGPAETQRFVPNTGILPTTVVRDGGLTVIGGEDSKDFGKIRQGESREHAFGLVSDGEGPLVINGIKPSCGCTLAEISLVGENGELTPYNRGDEIPSGTELQLLTQVSTDGKMGPFTAQVSLYSNSPVSPMNVRLVAEIEPVLKVGPQQSVFFGRMTTADRMEEALEVTSADEEPFTLSLMEESVQAFETLDVTYEPVEPDAEGKATKWNVLVALGPDTPVGMRNYPVRFMSDIEIPSPKYPNPDGSPKYHLVQINVQAKVTGMVFAEPGFITFGLVKPGDQLERTVRVEVHDEFELDPGMPMTLEGLQGQPFPYGDAFSMALEAQEDGQYLLRMRLDGLPEEVNGSFGGILKLSVGHPYMDELTIRFSGVCRQGLPGGSGN